MPVRRGSTGKLALTSAGSSRVTYEYMNFVRNTIRYKLPDRDYPCDVLMGVPVGFEQLSITAPYYRSTYVLVFPQGKGLDEVKTGDDLFRLFKATDAKPVIGLFDRTPASA